MSLHELGIYGGFIACVALATCIQNLTGFAFSLVLLGLVALFDLVPVIDAANAATVLTLVNAASFFRMNRLQPEWRVIKPSLLPSLVGVAIGVALLAWLSGNAVQVLRGLLGLAIVGCAVLLMLDAKPRRSVSGAPAFAAVGLASGLMGGLFSSAGPPMVYHMYRQPLPRELVKQCLILMFAINQVLRLLLVLLSGHFSWKSALLSAGALPVVHGVGWLQHRYMPPVSAAAVRRVVCVLLLLSGGSLLLSFLRA
ncbi:sulfite exporter TauE/SafE family protein [Paucibacter sp. R3-3]|uniref:Probable membrane transporter protein n=1 Tax=Roseateles agri TaxID=3098619 RepID=A0ABU5DIX3_9BURK|nr:sulfite exporter TauE/SafE family protein [Paucibacter sp. R3-3]MDY0745726.1 sulfite exporter TauE/SafE family protein [Paucibacter sp. R3-3]